MKWNKRVNNNTWLDTRLLSGTRGCGTGEGVGLELEASICSFEFVNIRVICITTERAKKQ